ncbi:MAG: DUF4398 domain-containing protein [Methanobacteriota archaeon]
MIHRAIVIVTILLTSGCIGLDTGDETVEATLAPLDVPIAVHVVRVGLAAGVVDEATLLPLLPTERRPVVESVSGTTGTPTFQPIVYRFSYAFHDAPADFAKALFEYALTTGDAGRPNAWLADYDREGQRRLCSMCSPVDLDEAKDVLYLDALKTEDWIRENRAGAGLEFGPGSVTIFLFDGEGAGVFPTDTYHYWRFDDGHPYSAVPKTHLAPTVEPPMGALDIIETPPFHTPKDPISMRAWGARYDFVWLDLTAAPSAYDFTPRRPREDWTDPPLWDLADDPAKLHENLGMDLSDFLQIRVGRDPIYPVRPFTRFLTPIHVFVEKGAQENPQTGLGVDLESWVPQADIEESFRLVMPWVESEAPVTFHMLPEDDPGMDEALRLAKRYSDPTLVAAGVVKSYVRENWDAYVPPAAPGEFVMPQFYYYFNGPYTFWGVSSAGGWADGDAWGRPWAIFNHFFDLCVRATTFPCSKSTIGFKNLTLLPIHEAGHELGLTHTKDSVNLNEESWPEGHTNWLWDSTFSMMSYRHIYMRFDEFDQRFLALSHTMGYLEEAHAALEAGSGEPAAGRARDAMDEARRLVAAGDYVGAVTVAREAARLAREASTLQSFGDVVLDPDEDLVELQLTVPASQSLVGFMNLGVAVVPNPADLDAAGASYAATKVDVPEDARYVHLKYKDANPQYAGTFKQSFAILLGPEGDYRGGLFESFEDEVYLTSHWRGGGPHELRVYQFAGTPGLYDVAIGIGR